MTDARQKPLPPIEISCAVSDAVLTAVAAFAAWTAAAVNPILALVLGSIAAAAAAGTIRFGLLPALYPVHMGLTALSRLVCLPLLPLGIYLGYAWVAPVLVAAAVGVLGALVAIGSVLCRARVRTLARTVLPALGLAGTVIVALLHQPILHNTLVGTLALMVGGLALERHTKVLGVKVVDWMHYLLVMTTMAIMADFNNL